MKTLNSMLWLGLASVMLSSCVSLKSAQTEAPVRTNVAFVRSTVDSPITRYRKINRARVVFTDKLLIASNAHDGLVAYDIKTGNRKWSYAVPNGVEKEPAVFNNRLYFGGNDGYFYSVNLESGQELWKTHIKSEIVATPADRKSVV